MPFDPKDPQHRRQAWWELYMVDHGFLRAMFQNWREVAPGMYRCNQPSPKHVAQIAARGIKTIINLRGVNDSGHYHLEREAADKLGIAMIDFPVKSRDTPQKDVILGLDAIFRRIEYPAVMHCKSGADRAGLAAVVYLVLKENRPVSEALDHLSLKYLHVRQGKTGMLDHFFDTFLAWAKAHGKPDDRENFLYWLNNVYDPAAVKADFMSSWWANILVDKILRRE
jgi:uncharacterized protein (TIGR01244 family)